MADLPILFSAPMVRAILREIEAPGTGKTQTRRVLIPRGANVIVGCYEWNAAGQEMVPIPRAKRGDRLYVRETWAPLDALTHSDPGVQALADGGFYRADDSTVEGEISRWRPGIHMPRWASRLTLAVTDVRVQRLQEISEADAVAEGIYEWEPRDKDGMRHFGLPELGASFPTAVRGFRDLWDRLNAERGYGWETNPWVAAITFNPTLRNIDQMGAA